MNPFRYERASDASNAIALLTQAPNGAYLGGGTNLIDHMKLGVRHPDLLVDITRLPYDQIEVLADGSVRIGAMVRNSDLAADRTIRARYPLVSQALPGSCATLPQRAATCSSAHAVSTFRISRSHVTNASLAVAAPHAMVSPRPRHPRYLAGLYCHPSLGHGRRSGRP